MQWWAASSKVVCHHLCRVLQASKKWRENQLDLSRQKATAQLSSMNAATAQLVTLTSGDQDDVDYTAVGAAVNQM